MNPESLTTQIQNSHRESPLIGIGEFLVQENFITPLDCKKVLEIQKKEDVFKGLPLTRIVKDTKRLSPQHFSQLFLTPHFHNRFIAIIQEKQLLAPKIIDNCIKTKNTNQSLPEYLGHERLLSQDIIDDIIFNDLGDATLISHCLKHGYITSADMTFATNTQQRAAQCRRHLL